MPLSIATWDNALRGDFAGAVAARAEASPCDGAAIDALLALVSDAHRAPTLRQAFEVSSHRALSLLSLRAALRGDAPALEEILAAQVALGRTLEAAITARWLALFGVGQAAPPAEAESDTAETRILYTALSALEALCAGAILPAVATARRAVRMARAEGIVVLELLTSLVLARCRRWEGRPHLATRILATVDLVAPKPWRGWLRYEQALAGELDRSLEEDFVPARLLDEVLLSARSGDRSRLHAARLAAPRCFRSEFALVVESLDIQSVPEVSPPGWLDGTSTRCPPAITALCAPEVMEGGDFHRVWLHAAPGRPVRRMLALGVNLVEGVALPPHFNLGQARTHTAIAHLATEPGLERAALFERVYGFPFLQDRHGGTLRVLLHRVRQALPVGVSLDEADCLRVSEEVLLPDPRIVFETDMLVLRHLARNAGRASAQEIATALGVSARTVQTTLRTLLTDGTCTTVREGRRVEYQLEDTTLSEPTLSRLHPRGLAELDS